MRFAPAEPADISSRLSARVVFAGVAMSPAKCGSLTISCLTLWILALLVFAGSEPLAAARRSAARPQQTPVALTVLTGISIIDVHTHITFTPENLDRLQRVMEENGIAQMASGAGNGAGRGVSFADAVAATAKFPGRFIVFGGLNRTLAGDPQFAKLVAQQLETEVSQGARGAGELSPGLSNRNATGARLAFDDARLDDFWHTAGVLGIPVQIHTADPEPFFRPFDPSNALYGLLKIHPEWSWVGPQFPSFGDLETQFVNVVARHPETNFIGCHFIDTPSLRYLSALFDRYPNLYVDTAARVWAFRSVPTEELRNFFIRYQDRILFGTDLGARPNGFSLGISMPLAATEPDVKTFYDRWKLFLASGQKDLWPPDPVETWEGNWRVAGLNLPRPVLQKILHDNAARLIPSRPGRPPY
jgi:Amidohydrolase